MRTDYIPEETFRRILWTLTPPNATILRAMMDSGMRISDCLLMERQKLFTPENDETPAVYPYVERKTGKERVAHFSRESYLAMKAHCKIAAYSPYVFEGRDAWKPRTRQAVWKDLNRAAKLWRVNGKKLRANLGTHSARKIYAVKLFHAASRDGKYDPLHVVQVDMNHKDPAVTFLYAMADVISKRHEA